jgi:hypothetical protein
MTDFPILPGESIGQNEPRWNRLRGLIDSYPKDSGILKELIQNADDGQARNVRIILDERQHSELSAPHPGLQRVCGPAIISFNDAPFQEQDFKNLANLANSAKIEDAFKTGRFGLGFNSVYNVTDYPILLTRDKLWCLDPCETLFEDPRGGIMWPLGDLQANRRDGILGLFFDVGYKQGNADFAATAFRLPLRNADHIRLNRDPERGDGHARISSTPFTAKDFEEVVGGLSKIAHELLLFLKNVESVSCSRIAPDGSQKAMLNIRITNPEQVRRGRAVINKVLQRGIEATLSECQSSDEGRVESCFEAGVEVTAESGSTETTLWQIASGIYAGVDECLIEASRSLGKVNERGLPHAGVAVCIQRGKAIFPRTEGRVFCYLPIADKDYSGKLPLHIHGAFSLDDSRTSLSGHREDEHHKQALRAKWNDLLLEHGVAAAYATALTQLATFSSERLVHQQLAESIYQLFPSEVETLPSHLALLAEAAIQKLVGSPVFLDSQKKWCPAPDLLDVPEDADLEECLTIEGFSFPSPRLPSALRSTLLHLKALPPPLEAEEIKDHFSTETAIKCHVREHPFGGLRSENNLLAVARFLVSSAESDWSGLPLALCKDGYCHTISEEVPILIGTDRQNRILALAPERLVISQLAELLKTLKQLPTGFESANAENWLPVVGEKLAAIESGSPTLNPLGKPLPNTSWLQDVFDELNSIEESQRPKDEVIDAAPIIPDSRQRLHSPGNAETPLLLQMGDQGFVPLLDALQISYFILRQQDKLRKCLTTFRDEYKRVWSLTPPDLIDSLHARLSELEPARSRWAKRAIIDPLLRFFESKWDDEERSVDATRLARLKELPFFEDQNGDFGPISNTCYIAGAFSLPRSIDGLRLIRSNGLDRLLVSIGVNPLTRQSLLLKWVLPHYSSRSSEVQLDWLRWIRDEWNRLVGEMGSSEEMVECISESHLIRSTSGTMRSIQSCYHPNSRELVESILGETVSFPDMSYYNDEPSLWLSFFENCGVQTSPQVQDLARYIEQLGTKVDEEGVMASTSNSIVRLAKHIFSHWSQLRDQEVRLSDQSRVPFFEHLRSRSWLPAARGRDLDRFVVGQDPEQRLFRPDELYLFATGYLVASKHALLPSSFFGLTSDLLADLGIRSAPDWQDVAFHFNTLLEVLGEGPFVAEDLKLIRTTFEAVYRYFGQSPERFLGTDEAPIKINPVKERFSHVPCIFMEKEKCLRRPVDVYKTTIRSLSPLKCVGKFSDPTLDKGLEVLGRADQPGVDDLAEALIDLQSEQPQQLDTPHQKSVNRVLDLLTELLFEDPDNREPPLIAVMNEEGRLVSPCEVIYGDDAWLAGELNIPPELLLHPDTPARVVQLWEVPSLRQAKETPVRLEQKVSSAFARQCEELDSLLHSNEFQTGLARIVYHCHSRLPEETCLDSVKLLPCSDLLCRYTIELENRDVDLGEAPADFHFNAELDGGTIFVNQDCQEVLHERIAESVCRILGEYAPGDKSALVTILQRKPGQISGTLNRLRITQLPKNREVADGDDSEGDLFETSGTTDGFDETTEGYSSDAGVEADDDLEGDVEDDETEESSDDQEGEQEDDTDLDTDSDTESDDDDANEHQDLPSNRGGSRSDRDNGGTQSRSARGSQSAGGGRRAGGPRGRMLPGRNTGASGGGENGQTGPRRSRVQGDRWASYAVTQDQMESNRMEDDSNDDESPRSKSIALAAVGFVMQFERSQGRKPQNMAHANPGYDIESKQGRIIDRYIEVKGIDAEWGKRGVPLSPIQLNKAQELGDKFWLYVVENCTDPATARLHMIQNPAAKITQFSFDSGWRQAGEVAKSFQVLEPREGLTLVEHDEDGVREGKITEVSPSEKTIWLKVRFDPGAPATSVIYDPIRMQVRA